jgi:hypothetical protein
MTRLVLTFPDSKTAQQFAGWLFLEGYPDRAVEKNTVTVEVPREELYTIVEEAQGRNGKVKANQ